MDFSPKRQQIQEKDKGQCFVKKRAQACYIIIDLDSLAILFKDDEWQ